MDVLTEIAQPFIQFWPQLVVIALIWLGLQYVSSILMDALLPMTDRMDIGDRDSRVVGLIHAFISCTLALLALFEPDSNISKDHVNGVTYLSHLCLSISSAYFLWDLYVVVRFNQGVGFIIHAICCFFIYTWCLTPFIQYYACIFLLFELSTPFLHLRYFLIQAKKTETPAFALVQPGFAITFFFARIFFGLYFVFHWWMEMLPLYHNNQLPVPSIVMLTFFTINIALNCLNVYWFTTILVKALKPKKDKSAGPKEH